MHKKDLFNEMVIKGPTMLETMQTYVISPNAETTNTSIVSEANVSQGHIVGVQYLKHNTKT